MDKDQRRGGGGAIEQIRINIYIIDHVVCIHSGLVVMLH